MKKVAVVVLAMALLMMCAAVAPAFAAPQPHGTFTQVGITLGGPWEKTWMTGDISHSRNRAGIAYLYGAPFPLGNTISSFFTNDVAQMNLVDFTGMCQGHTQADNYAAGTMKGSWTIEFTGGGVYVYTGPTFTFTLGPVTATLHTGDVFGGVLLDARLDKQGVGGLAGFTAHGTADGLIIYAVVVGDTILDDVPGDFGLFVENGMYTGP